MAADRINRDFPGGAGAGGNGSANYHATQITGRDGPVTLIATCASCERLLNLLLLPAPGSPAPRTADIRQSRREITPELLWRRLGAIERVLQVREAMATRDE